MDLDQALLKITELQAEIETEKQINLNLTNELNTTKQTVTDKDSEIARLQGINQQFFLKLTQQDNQITKPVDEKLKTSPDDTLSVDDLIKKIIK